MNKFITLILILVIAPILGGIYGIIHDQITYTISSEYYTKFKFIQFGLENWGLGKNIGTNTNPEIILRNPRFGASIIGFLATWWMGMIIGIILALVGLLHKKSSEMFKTTLKAFLLTTGIALITGIIGLLFGKLFLVKNNPNWYFPKNLIDLDSFIIVGSMHNFSYIGGLIGLVAGVIFSVKKSKAYNSQNIN